MGNEPKREARSEAAVDFVERMKRMREETEAALLKARDDMKRWADHDRGEVIKYKVGDKIMVDARELELGRPSKKLSERWIGPYPITALVGTHAVKIKLPKSIRIHPVLSLTRVKPYHTPILPGQTVPPPPPVEIEGEKEYVVDEVRDSRLRQGNLEYLVKWRGYGEEENTWEPASNLVHADHAVKDFHRHHPSVPRRLRRADFDQMPFREPTEPYHPSCSCSYCPYQAALGQCHLKRE
jgi:hypothetical protein